MGLKGKLIAEYETSYGDLLHDLLATKPHHISKIAPAQIQGCQLLEGEFGKNGSILLWNYTINGKAFVSKKVVENVCMDGANKTLTMREIEGDLLKTCYKKTSLHLHVKASLINWTLEYERLNEDVPHPTAMLEMILNVCKNFEDQHLKA